jgi:quercetin dioxygenase-like cupin family protein
MAFSPVSRLAVFRWRQGAAPSILWRPFYGVIAAEGTNMRRGSIGSYAVVASAASLLSIVAMASMRPSNAQPAAAPPRQMLTQPLPDLPGREVRISLLDRPPLASSPPHRHPGHHTFGYVLEGTYEFAINGEAPRTLKAGEAFYEPPGALHSTSRNPSGDARAKILVFMVADQKNPSTVPQ